MSFGGLLNDIFYCFWADAQVAYIAWFLSYMNTTSFRVGTQLFIVNGKEEVAGVDFIVEGGADKESDVDLERECAYKFVVWYVLAVYGRLQSLVCEDVNADASIY